MLTLILTHWASFQFASTRPVTSCELKVKILGHSKLLERQVPGFEGWLESGEKITIIFKCFESLPLNN